MADPAESGLTISEWIAANHGAIACYVVSTAGDALVGSIGLHELGVTGVFLKPVDTGLIIQTLRTRLTVAAGA